MEPLKPLLMKLKESLTIAMKNSEVDAKDILRVLLAKIQIMPSAPTDEQVINLIKTLISQNDEDIAGRIAVEGGEKKYFDALSKLQNQNTFLKGFLPTFLTEEQIVATLTTEDNLKQINSAKNDGAATGVGLKILKSLPEFAGMAMDGALVKEVVKRIYKQG